MKKKFFIVVFLAIFIFVLPNKSNAYSSDPKQFVTEIVNEAKKILVDSNTSEFKEKKLSEIALKAADIKTLGDLVSIEISDMMKFRNFGKKSLTELEELVEGKGLNFGMDLDRYNLD